MDQHLYVGLFIGPSFADAVLLDSTDDETLVTGVQMWFDSNRRIQCIDERSGHRAKATIIKLTGTDGAINAGKLTALRLSVLKAQEEE